MECDAFVTTAKWGNIPFGEKEGSPMEYYEGGVLRVTRTFIVDWDFRWEFVIGVLGTCSLVPTNVTDSRGNVFYGIRRTLPQTYLSHPAALNGTGRSTLYATTLNSIRPIGPQEVDPTGFSFVYEHAKAEITITYETKSYDLIEDAQMPQLFDEENSPDESNLDRFVTRVVQPAAEALTLPYNPYKYVTTPPRAILGSRAIIIPTMEVHYIWHQVPGRPSALADMLGAVNSEDFHQRKTPTGVPIADDYHGPAGTYLLLGSDFKPYRLVDGTRVADITYKIKYFSAPDFSADPPVPFDPPRGHNFFIKFDPGGDPEYVEVTSNGTSSTAMSGAGQPVYRKMNFQDLFNPDRALVAGEV